MNDIKIIVKRVIEVNGRCGVDNSGVLKCPLCPMDKLCGSKAYSYHNHYDEYEYLSKKLTMANKFLIKLELEEAIQKELEDE